MISTKTKSSSSLMSDFFSKGRGFLHFVVSDEEEEASDSTNSTHITFKEVENIEEIGARRILRMLLPRQKMDPENAKTNLERRMKILSILLKHDFFDPKTLLLENKHWLISQMVSTLLPKKMRLEMENYCHQKEKVTNSSSSFVSSILPKKGMATASVATKSIVSGLRGLEK